MEEQEVEREVQLVLAEPVERDQLLEVEHVGLPHEHRLVLARAAVERAPAAQHVVQLRAVHRVDLLEPALDDVRVVVRPRQRVVAQLAVLDDRVADVDPEAGDAAVEPEREHVVDRLAQLLVPPVEVGLASAGTG